MSNTQKRPIASTRYNKERYLSEYYFVEQIKRDEKYEWLIQIRTIVACGSRVVEKKKDHIIHWGLYQVKRPEKEATEMETTMDTEMMEQIETIITMTQISFRLLKHCKR